MGRPIKKKFFGNLNPGGVGGEGVASVTIAGSYTGYNGTGVNAPAVTFSAPASTIVGGVTATGTVIVNGAGTITSIRIDNSGSGYTTPPTVVLTGTGSPGTSLTAVLTTNRSTLNVTAYIPVKNGGLAAKQGDIEKQESDVRYLVTTADGTGQCALVAAAPVAGQMNLIATDSGNNTYYVTKLTAKKARLVQRTLVAASYQFVSNTLVQWTVGTAVVGVSVSLASN